MTAERPPHWVEERPGLITDEEREYMETVIRMAALAFTVVLWVLTFLTVSAIIFWGLIIYAVVSG